MSPRNTTGLSVGVSTGAVPKAQGRPRTQAGTATQGRGAGEEAEPVGTATDDEPSAEAGRPAERLRCRYRAQRQGPHHLLELHQCRSRDRWPSKIAPMVMGGRCRADHDPGEKCGLAPLRSDRSFQAAPKNSETVATASGFSSRTRCPASVTICTLASGIDLAHVAA